MRYELVSSAYKSFKLVLIAFIGLILTGTLVFSNHIFQNKNPNQYKENHMLLRGYIWGKDDLGFERDIDFGEIARLKFSIPAYFDTTQIWIDRSDCGSPCEHVKHRVTSKQNCCLMESGFFKKYDCKDSIFRLTIESYQDKDTSLSRVVKRFIQNSSYTDSFIGNFKFRVTLKSIFTLNHRNFGCVEYYNEEYRKKHLSHHFQIYTFFENRVIIFDFECTQQKNENLKDFVRIFLESLIIESASNPSPVEQLETKKIENTYF